LEAAELLCLEKVEELKNISLSRNPAAKHINSIANYLRAQLTRSVLGI
jgi:hypothetical protein